jgi:hypothetical protein
MTNETRTLPTQAEYNEFLNDLRESGIVNMFGAAIYVQDHFDVSKTQAKDALLAWMKSFGK